MFSSVTVRYVKKWENETHDRRKTDPEMTEIMELVVKVLKIAAINILSDLKDI